MHLVFCFLISIITSVWLSDQVYSSNSSRIQLESIETKTSSLVPRRFSQFDPSLRREDPVRVKKRPRWQRPCERDQGEHEMFSLKNQGSRNRRSIIASFSDNHWLDSGGKRDKDKFAILFKGIPNRGSKKTSFSVTLSNRPKSSNKLKTRTGIGQNSRVKFESTGFVAIKTKLISKVKSSETRIYQRDDPKSNEIIENIEITQARIVWVIASSFGQLESLESIIGNIESKLRNERNLNESRLRLSQLNQLNDSRKWLPKFSSLLQSELNSRDPLRLVAEVVRYMQMVLVAIEQMIFDRYLMIDQPSKEQFESLELESLKFLCSFEKISQHISTLRFYQEELVLRYKALTGDSSGNKYSLNRFYNSSCIDSMNKILGSQVEPATKLKTFDPIERSIMPIEQRRLKTEIERTLRDASILKDLRELSQYSDNLLRQLVS